jgi:hypothetical protein
MRLVKRCSLYRWFTGLCLLLLLSGAAACGGSERQSPPHAEQTTIPTTPAATNPLIARRVIVDMLNNIKENGYNADSSINAGKGGLWINWRYGTTPLVTNLNGSGVPDSQGDGSLRHDPLTDLRYVRALWLYKKLYSGDTQFDSELARYSAIVKYEFASPDNERGWLYDMFIDLYRLSKDTFYRDAARELAQYYFKKLYHPEAGAIYKVGSGHSNGYSRVDLSLEAGCALIQAGTLFNQPDWIRAGRQVVDTLYQTSYLERYHVFLTQMDNVTLPGGKLNPDPLIYRGKYGSTNIQGGSVRLGAVAQEILSLLHVYSVTHDRTFLNRAMVMLDSLTANQNSLGLWDKQNGGYFAAVTFSGPDAQNPGKPGVNKHYKESGRQVQMLEAFRVANSLTHNRYAAMQDTLLQVTLKRIYYAPGHGVLYQATADWQPVPLKQGGQQDWVTTEAMGIALESLFSLSDPLPW